MTQQVALCSKPLPGIQNISSMGMEYTCESMQCSKLVWGAHALGIGVGYMVICLYGDAVNCGVNVVQH